MRRDASGPLRLAPTLACGVLVAVAAAPPHAAATPDPTDVSQGRDEAPEVRLLERGWPVDLDGELRVRVGDADVAVGPAPGARAEVEIWLRSNDLEWAREEFQRRRFEAVRDGSAVRVTSVGERRGHSRGWHSDERRWMSVRVEVRVPASFSLELLTGDGDVEVGEMAGAVLIDTGDGDVDLAELQGPEITIHTADGDIRAVALRASRVDVETQDGDIQVGEVDGDLSLLTSDGDIRIGNARSTEATLRTQDGDIDLGLARAARLAVETGDGDVFLQLPGDARADLDLEGDDVDIQGDALQLQGRVQRRWARAELNGGGPTLRVRSRDGSVRLLVGS